MTSPAKDFFAGSGTADRNSASAAFRTVGDVCIGVIVEEPIEIDQTVYGKGTPKLDKNGKVQTQLVVVLQTDSRNWDKALKTPTDETGASKPGSVDTGLRALFVKFKLRDAIGEAIRKAGASGLEVGGKLSVAYTNESTFNGNEVKEYAAKYEPPVTAAGADFFNAPAPAAAASTPPPF